MYRFHLRLPPHPSLPLHRQSNLSVSAASWSSASVTAASCSVRRCDASRCCCCRSRCRWTRPPFQPRIHCPSRQTLLPSCTEKREGKKKNECECVAESRTLPSAWSRLFVPFTQAELLLALLLVHGAVAVQVVESPAFLLALTGAGSWRAAVLLPLLCLQDGGHILPPVACDVGHVFPPAGSCGQWAPLVSTRESERFSHLNAGSTFSSLIDANKKVSLSSYLRPLLLWCLLQLPPRSLRQIHRIWRINISTDLNHISHQSTWHRTLSEFQTCSNMLPKHDHKKLYSCLMSTGN